jgi:hypothetical protein
MQMLTTAAIALLPTLLLSVRSRAKEVIAEINQACLDRGVPQAFDLGTIAEATDLEEIHFRCNPDFRFEGFGMDVIPPKLTFWVWYKKGEPEGVELGKFHITLGTLGEFALNLVPLGNLGALVNQIDDVVEGVENLVEVTHARDA